MVVHGITRALPATEMPSAVWGMQFSCQVCRDQIEKMHTFLETVPGFRGSGELVLGFAG